jgi:hypothetical protein
MHAPFTFPPPPAQVKTSPIHADLVGSHSARAFGLVARGPSPVLLLCRQLVELGQNPDLPLEAWRGKTLCLYVRSIGEAAGLEINNRGTGFVAARGVRPASPVRFAGRRAVS